MSPHRVIGKRIPRVDGLERVTGQALFGADLTLPGTLHGKVFRSPYAHAKIRRIDSKRALVLDGVVAVITAEDLPPMKENAWAPLGEMEIDMASLASLVIAREKAVFHGQAVAAVAATNPRVAEDALGLIEVEWEELPVVEDLLVAMKPGGPIIHPDLRTTTMAGKGDVPTNVAAHMELERGDVERNFAEADVVLENTFRTTMVHQGYIEPQACTAQVTPDGRITVWTTTQGAFTIKMQLAGLLSVPHSSIRVVPLEIGGGFGGKIFINLEPLAILLARKSGRPVKMVMTREEVFRATGPASPAVITIKTGAKKDGRLTAVKATFIYDAGCFPGSPVSAAMVVGLAPYGKVPNLRVDGYDVVTNKPCVNAYRAPGAPQAAFAVESQMDMTAEAIGMDPLDFRMINASEAGDPLPNGIGFNRIGLTEILKRIKTHPYWNTPLTVPNRGRGLALGYWRGATFTSSAHCIVNGDGTISLVLGAVDLTGTRTTMAQMAAEEFGVEPHEISVTVGDTEMVGYSDVSGGSRITYMQGTAVHRACQDALAQLRNRAAIRLGVGDGELGYADRAFYVGEKPEQRVSVVDMARASLVGGEGPIVGRGTATKLQPAHAFGAHLAEVEVDTETGKVKILRYTVFQDVGCAVNPTQVEGQMQGGASQGIGWALSESYIFDRGIMKNATLLDYRMPVALDLPMIETVIVEVPASDGPYGVRGVGEVPIVPPPGALANAIYRAAGVRMKELPMNPEAIWRALQTGTGR